MTGIEQWFGWFMLAILAGILVWGMAALQATLMASSKAGASAEMMMMMAVGGTDTETEDDDLDDLDLPEGVTPADCGDYTYPQQAERLYDTRTYDRKVDEWLASIERRIAALEKLIDGRM